MSMPSNAEQALRGARDVIPMALAAATYGVTFGILATKFGFSLFQSLSASTLIFAGASQLISLDQLTVGAGVLSAILAGAVLNLRIMLITASMKNYLTDRPWWQVVLGVFLATDVSVALMQMAKQKYPAPSYWYLFGGGFVMLLVWVCATGTGVLMSQGLPNPEMFGLDFAIAAVFIAMLPALWQGKGDLLPWVISAGIVALFLYLFPTQTGLGLLLGALAGAAVAGGMHER